MSSYLAQFDDHNRQLRTVKHWPIPFPAISQIGLPAHPLISIDPQVRFGRPCIMGTRISVADVLAWLGNGMSIGEIIDDFPELDEEMIQACLRYAANH
ncbi:MAG: DUF433 domain-containing protein [Hymenobacter sp.]|nr:MAG: DUF433 domain-containing protein [Hymenobacter sp.]